MSTTQQSTNVHNGGGWNGRGIAWRLRLLRGFWSNLFFLGGGKINIVLHFATERAPHRPVATSKTPQSTNVRWGGGWKGEGMAWQLRFYKWTFVEFSAGGGVRHSDFETRRTKAIEPPGPSQQQHSNQTMDERVGAQVARGVCMGGRSDLPFLPCCYC